jgi:hypothetical protein
MSGAFRIEATFFFAVQLKSDNKVERWGQLLKSDLVVFFVVVVSDINFRHLKVVLKVEDRILTD